MTAVDQADDLDDLLPEDLQPGHKHKAVPLVRTPAQVKESAKQVAKRTAAEEKAALETANAVRLAQIVNLHIAGFSLADIGASVGASAEEIDRLLTSDTARYVRSQPALRTYVRNWLSAKYTGLLDAVWTEATDKTHREKLEHQDRALRILDRMAKLHGAEMPVQSEVKVEAAPEAVERLVAVLARGQGLGYDESIFDIVEAEVVHDAHEAADEAERVSGNVVEESDGHDAL